MSQTVSFPGLGLELTIDRVAFTLGPLTVYWYGVLIATGLLLALVYLTKRAPEFRIDADKATDVVLLAVVFGFIGARIYYVAFSWEAYKGDLSSVFRIWEGGIAIYGGVIAGMLAGVLLAKRAGICPLRLLDLCAPGLILAQGIGRWGNFLNVEAFGCNTTLPWGMTAPGITAYLTQHKAALEAFGAVIDPAAPVHPTFFYESVWCIAGFCLLAWYTPRRRYDGEILLLYVGWYGMGRVFIEGLRTDSLMLGSVRISQLVAGLCVLAAAALFLSVNKKLARGEAPRFGSVLPYADEPEASTTPEASKITEEAAEAHKEEPNGEHH